MRIDLTDDEKEKINQIGNLLIISRHTNSEFGNKSVNEKVDLLEKDKKYSSNLRYINDFILDFKESQNKWDFEDIVKRTKKLSSLAYDHVWRF